jgi:hypothetical protein
MNSEALKQHSPGPKPERAIYGFFCLSSAIISFIIYIIISYLPDSVFVELGWVYLPEKLTLVLVPYLIVIMALMIYPVYIFLNKSAVNSRTSINSIRDEFSLDKFNETKNNHEMQPNSIDPVYDIPLSDMCQRLFLAKSNR